MDEVDEKTSSIVKVVVMPTFLFIVWIASAQQVYLDWHYRETRFRQSSYHHHYPV
jgi:hypothetical protein